MKKIFSYLTVAMLLFTSRELMAQIIIDVSSGVDNTTGLPIPDNSLIPYNHIDDTWTVHTPTDAVNFYQSAAIGNGYRYNGQYALCPGSKWISPYIGANGLTLNSGAMGDYYYKMTFTLNMCPACRNQPVKIHFDCIGGDDNVTEILVNGHSYPISPGYSSVVGVITSNVDIPIQSSHLVAGINEIQIKVFNAGSGFNGMQVKGKLIIDDPLATTVFKDKNGISKTEFCLGEDVFLQENSLTTTGYQLDLYKMNGTIAQLLASTSIIGNPFWVNVTDVFSTTTLQPNTTYRVKLTLNSSCDPSLVVTKEFSVVCCTNSPDASFEMDQSSSTLWGSSGEKGTHDWKIYNTPNAHTGPYLLVGSSTNPHFTFDIGNSCYYVVHKVTTACGTSCIGQSICNLDCEEGTCILSAPEDPQYDNTTKIYSWTPGLTGASNYVVETIVCDPHCCGGSTGGTGCPYTGGSGGVSTSGNSNVKRITVTGATSYVLGPNDFAGLVDGIPPCFSIRVYAVCPDGSSMGSDLLCSQGNPPSGRNAYTGPPGNSNPQNTAISIFPNPTKGVVSIDLNMGSDLAFNIIVFDKVGRVVKAFDDLKTTGKKANIIWNTESLNKGMYLVKIVTSDNQVITKKLVVE